MAIANRRGRFYAENVPLARIAEACGTPCYVYSRAALEANWRAFDTAFGDYPHHIHYAVKANGNLAVLDTLARLGSGFDVVSAGELARVLAAGGRAYDCIFSGVGKRADELRAALAQGIGCIHVESEAEFAVLRDIARETGKRAPIAIRLNPDVDARTHPYISTGLKENKFGLPAAQALALYRAAADEPHWHIRGLACHIGSQIMELGPYQAALAELLRFIKQLSDLGINLEYLDLGGGLGVRYTGETPPSPADYAAALVEPLRAQGLKLPVVIEPGRSIAADAGVLLTKVVYLKPGEQRNFCIVDAGMNDLLRPALYQARHPVWADEPDPQTPESIWEIVGPVCESADFIARSQPLAVRPGQLLVVGGCGAYAAVMNSHYNARPRAAEVMVDGDRWQVVRQRETIEDLFANERRLDDNGQLIIDN